MQKKYTWALIGASISLFGMLTGWALHNQLPEGVLPELVQAYSYPEAFTFLGFTLFGFLFGNCLQKIDKLALTDPLTKVFTRQHVLDSLDGMIAQNAEYGESFSLVMFDLDGLTKVNDDFGHRAGDTALVTFASIAKKHIDRNQSLGRCGEGEFLLICPRKQAHEAVQQAEKIRHDLERVKEKKLGRLGPQTVSAGVYEILPGMKVSVEELLEVVRTILQDAKVKGRNKIVSRATTASHENSQKEG